MTSYRLNVPDHPGSMTTLVCLFHDRVRAQEVVEELLNQGFKECSVIGPQTFGRDRLLLEFAHIGVPAQHNYRFAEVVAGHGGLVWLRCSSKVFAEAERILERHKAELIDEAAIHGLRAKELLAA